VTSVFVSHGVNVDEITTRRREAPMAGGRLFEITAELRCPPQTSLDDLRRGLEALSSELTVDITHRVDGDGAG
jgi:glycine cleavage system regulatory protein